MNESWFYHPEEKIIANSLIALAEDESHHLSYVLRFEAGNPIIITNGKGLICQSTIEKINKKQVLVRINQIDKLNAPPHNLHLAIGLLKHRDKMEWLVEKSTEIGVSKISFLQTEHAERSKLNIQRLEKIVVSSIKQSKNAFMPFLNYEKSFQKFINGNFDEYQLKLMAYCGSTEFFTSKIPKAANTIFIIGPEGDFSQEEVNMATGKGFANVSLGEMRLRSETAAIYLLSFLKAISSQ